MSATETILLAVNQMKFGCSSSLKERGLFSPKTSAIGITNIEREALRRHGVREFYFGSGNFTGAEMAEALVKAVPQMRELSRSYSPPLVGSIGRSGHVTIVYDEHGSTHERRKEAAHRRENR